MLKIRLQGTVKDIKWFLKMMQRDKRFVMNNPSELMNIKGSEKYIRASTEVFKSAEDMKLYAEMQNIETKKRYFGTGTVFLEPRRD